MTAHLQLDLSKAHPIPVAILLADLTSVHIVPCLLCSWT